MQTDPIVHLGCELIKSLHPFKSHPVLSDSGAWYYGYGFKDTIGGDKLTQDARPITLLQANKHLEHQVTTILAFLTDALDTRPSVNRCLALLSFTHDLGLKSLQTSDIIPALNNNDPHLALKEIDRGIYIRRRGVLMVCPHKSKRRKHERRLWVTSEMS